MKQPTKSMTLLSAMVLGVAGAQAQAQKNDQKNDQPAAKIQSLQLLNENRISYEEFKAMVGESFRNPSLSSSVNAGNYGNTVNAANYANTLNAGNYADTVNAANYANTINAGNYGLVGPESEAEQLPMPLGAGGK